MERLGVLYEMPEARSRKESRLTTIRHGGPCGLRSKMRSAEREGKSVVFDAPNAVDVCPRVRGGGGAWLFAQFYHGYIRLYDSFRCG